MAVISHWRRRIGAFVALALAAWWGFGAPVAGHAAPRASAFETALANLYASPAPAAPSIGPAGICDRAIAAAAQKHGAPLRLMRAVALVESGKPSIGADGRPRREAWPWTVNLEGAGRWFDSRAEALAFVRTALEQNRRSFDVGCMQINYRWHGDAFDSVDAMFDPHANADYAARFLRALMDETGDWMAAAALYHSRTPSLGKIYRGKVDAAFAEVDAAKDDAPPRDAVPAERPPPTPLVGRLGAPRPLIAPHGAERRPLIAPAGRALF